MGGKTGKVTGGTLLLTNQSRPARFCHFQFIQPPKSKFIDLLATFENNKFKTRQETTTGHKKIKSREREGIRTASLPEPQAVEDRCVIRLDLKTGSGGGKPKMRRQSIPEI